METIDHTGPDTTDTADTADVVARCADLVAERFVLPDVGERAAVRLRERAAAGAYGEEGALRSVADVTSQETLLQVRAYKQSVKAAKRG